MRIQYASDLHLEFVTNRNYLRLFPMKVTGDILVLAGDIQYLKVGYVADPFWDWASANYRQVIVALGNHEFYHGHDISNVSTSTIIDIRENVRAYYNAGVTIDDVEFIVSTLWAHIEPTDFFVVSHSVADFSQILCQGKYLTPDLFNEEHDRCLTFIKKAVAESKARHKVVVTHHVPSILLTAPEFRDSRINGAFTVELGNFIADSDIDCWIFGHSHRNIDATIGSTRCVSNQLGYVRSNEHRSFDPGKMIEI